MNLQEGVPDNGLNTTCTSGAGTLLLEFGMLSRLLKDPVYESLARRSVQGLWSFRSNVTGLFGKYKHSAFPVIICIRIVLAKYGYSLFRPVIRRFETSWVL